MDLCKAVCELRTISEYFNKRHDILLRDIRNLLLEFSNKLHAPSDVRSLTKAEIFTEIDRLQHENYIKNKLIEDGYKLKEV